jgi:hypothetical protein
MPDKETIADFNSFIHKHLAVIVIWGGVILGGCLGWYTSSLIDITEAVATTGQRSINNETVLLRHLEQGTNITDDINEIKVELGIVKGLLEESQ